MRVLGRYVLHGELAAGGMATVHLARLRGEAGFARTVAIKRLHPQFAKDPEFVAMFVDEARLAARIRHPNVVPTLDVISEDGEIFLVMEYVHGESLSRLLRALRTKKQRVSPSVAAGVLSGVLHGLHAAHEARSEKGGALGIVHRDVSPQNVLVGIDGIAHVLDFGVAKATGRLQTTREGQVKGKLAYMAPEQLDNGGALTRRSDVYAASVVLWETLTLKRLFEGETDAALLMKVVEGKIAPPSTLVPDLPRELDEVVMKGLQRDPGKRWQTARDMALALEKVGAMSPPSVIGEWVQGIAGEDLSRRAEKVREIEAGSLSMLPVAPRSDAGEAESGVRLGEPISQVSAVSRSERVTTATAGPYEEDARKRGRGHFIAGGLTGLLSMLLVVALTRGWGARHPAPSAPVAAAPVAITTASPTTTETPMAIPVPAPPTTGNAADPSVAPSDTATVTTEPTSPADSTAHAAGWAPHETKRAAAPPPPAPKPAAKPHPDCDPPFTRDAQGHKHYKLQCL